MAYLQSTGSQILLCLRGIGFGFLLGIGYELLRFVRMASRAGRSAVLWDVGFGAASAAAVFLFDLLYDDGRLRVYVMAAQCVGFWLWYAFAAPSVRPAERRLLAALRSICACVRVPIARLERRWTLRAAKCREMWKKSRKNTKKNEKPS